MHGGENPYRLFIRRVGNQIKREKRGTRQSLPFSTAYRWC